MVPLTVPELVARRAEKLLEEFCHQRAVRLEKPAVRLDWQAVANGYELIETFHAQGHRQHQGIAQLRFQPELQQWSLHQPHGEGWRFCNNINPSLDLEKLLQYLDLDPFRQFWR